MQHVPREQAFGQCRSLIQKLAFFVFLGCSYGSSEHGAIGPGFLNQLRTLVLHRRVSKSSTLVTLVAFGVREADSVPKRGLIARFSRILCCL